MTDAFICDAVRTPIGRYGGILAKIRADDLGAVPMKALLARNAGLDPAAIDEVFYGCANQSGEDNRNVARMSLLLAGLPPVVPGDYLVLHDTGAYGASMSSNYNSRPLLPEVLFDGGKARLIRRSQTIQELLSLELC